MFEVSYFFIFLFLLIVFFQKIRQDRHESDVLITQYYKERTFFEISEKLDTDLKIIFEPSKELRKTLEYHEQCCKKQCCFCYFSKQFKRPT